MKIREKKLPENTVKEWYFVVPTAPRIIIPIPTNWKFTQFHIRFYTSNTNSEYTAYTKNDVKDDQPCFRNKFQAIHFDSEFICDFLHNKMITFLE